MALNLPTQLLRSFVAIIDAGTMLGAAENIFLTQSALSLQIKRLEELIQQPLFSREGRRLVLTAAGTMLADYARKMLQTNDEALRALSDGIADEPIRLGTVQDFAETLLTGLLARHAQLHPGSQIFARVAGTADLLGLLARDEIDMVFGYAAADSPDALTTARTSWYGQPELLDRAILPLVVLETPCRFREAAITVLEAAGRPYRIAVETPNLSLLRAAIDAGLGVGCRTAFFRPDCPPLDGLPPLPDVACVIMRAADLSPHKARMAALATDAIRQL